MVSNFLFRRVNPFGEPFDDPMDPEQFDKCIRYINRRYEVVLFEDIAQKQLDENKQYACIMFEGGYKDNFDYALPMLDYFNIKASFYVVTDCIDRNIPVWPEMLSHIFRTTRIDFPNLDFRFLPQDMRRPRLTDRAKKIAYAERLFRVMKMLSHANQKLVLDTLRTQFTDVAMPRCMMDWDDLRMLTDKGHAIGSAGLRYAMPARMEDEDSIVEELRASALQLEDQLGFFPKTIAYPFGSVNDLVKRVARETGYEFGLGNKQDRKNNFTDDLLEIPRIDLANEQPKRLNLLLDPGFWKLKKILLNR